MDKGGIMKLKKFYKKYDKYIKKIVKIMVTVKAVIEILDFLMKVYDLVSPLLRLRGGGSNISSPVYLV